MSWRNGVALTLALTLVVGAACRDETEESGVGTLAAGSTTTTTTTTTATWPCNSLCPEQAPEEGSTCPPCLDYIECAIGECSNSTVSVYACYSGVWKAKGQRACCTFGGYCSTAGDVCYARWVGWEHPSFSCVADPCAPNPLTCSCAQEVCGGWDCSISGNTIWCESPTP